VSECEAKGFLGDNVFTSVSLFLSIHITRALSLSRVKPVIHQTIVCRAKSADCPPILVMQRSDWSSNCWLRPKKKSCGSCFPPVSNFILRV